MSLEVTRKGITDILALLKKGEWQVPQFQRDFVWNQEQVKKLIHSFIQSFPIGLITIWDQPQNKPHTPGEPLKLRDSSLFQEFEQNPAVIKLVLDGKQRLTTIAMVFGGFHTINDRYSYSGLWYINVDALATNDDSNLVIYKRQREVEREELNILAVCIRKALIPFKDFNKLGEYLQNIHNPAIYPQDEYPHDEIRNKRTTAINALLNNYNRFQIPVAEIPSSVTLGDVCEIFDVLNTTGTKVSTFDLLHNLLFKSSDGNFLLRDKFNSYKDLSSFGLLCDDERQEFLCQLVTGCYILDDNPVKASNTSEKVSSIKGKDLIDTPLAFYNLFDRNIQKVDSYVSDLFSNVLQGDFQAEEIPYPVSIIHYFALRWHLEFRLGADFYTVEELNKVFKAFFWRNILANRYDQGFLTLFSKDLKVLHNILVDAINMRNTGWEQHINRELDNFFGAQNKTKAKQDLVDLIKNADIRGATKQGISMVLLAHCKLDLVNGEKLNRFTTERGKKVQLHHIFPRDWCRNNRGTAPIIDELTENHAANLIPLTANSNNNWKALSPSTAIKTYNLDFNAQRQRFDGGFINIDSFNYLKQDKVADFWNYRADKIAEILYNLQFVS